MAEGEQIPLLRARAMMIACTALKAALSFVPLSLSLALLPGQSNVNGVCDCVPSTLEPVPANQLTAAN